MKKQKKHYLDNKKFLGPGGNQEQALNKVAKAL